MNSPLSGLLDPLQYAFMRNGLLEMLLLSIASGLVGVFVVQRQLTFYSHALSHTIFPALVLAAAMGADLAIGALVGAALTAVLVFRLERYRDVGHAGAVGVVFIELFAAGVVLVGLFRVKSPDIGASLVGNMLGVSSTELLLSAALVLGLAVVLGLLFWPLVLSSFDPGAARALGIRVSVLYLVLLALVAATAIVGVRVVGVILTVAVLVVPAATALRWTKRIRPAMALSGAVATVSGVLGLYVTYYTEIAPSSMMVLLLTACFCLSAICAPGGLVSRFVRAGPV